MPKLVKWVVKVDKHLLLTNPKFSQLLQTSLAGGKKHYKRILTDVSSNQ